MSEEKKVGGEEEEEEQEEEVVEGNEDEQAVVKQESDEVVDHDQAIGDKPDGTIVTEHHSGNNEKDDCSDLTDNNEVEEPEQAPRTFPQKLMDILSNEEYSDIISWLPHGNGFIIHKKKTFASEILPRYFKASKFTSFTRKLNRWGFARAPRGPETGAYYHKLFHRDKPELCTQMTSNSGNKYQSAPMQSHLLPAVPGMIAPALNPYYIPNPMMVMYPPMVPAMIPPMTAVPATSAATPQLTPQQQQALWQQQMQLFQLQQFQLMQQQQQQQAIASGARSSVPSLAPATAMQPTVAMPTLPTNPSSIPAMTTSSLNDKSASRTADSSSEEAGDNVEEDTLDALNPTDV